MDEKQTSINWNELQDLPEETFGSASSINNDIIIVCACKNYEVDGLLKYNPEDDTWQDWIDYPDNIDNVQKATSSIDHNHETKSSILFILAETKADFCWIKIDLKNQLCESFPYNKDFDNNKSGSADTNSAIFAINDTIHIFGGNSNANHLIMNTKTQTIRDYLLLSNYFDELEVNDTIYGYNRFGKIYLKSKQKILIFGGMVVFGGQSIPIDHMLEYSLITKQYTKLQLKLPKLMYYLSCTITDDEKYIIIFNEDGRNNFLEVGQEIFVLDTHSMKFFISNIVTPEMDDCSGSPAPETKSFPCIVSHIHKAKLLVLGYIRSQLNEMISNELIQLLTIFYAQEFVHFIMRRGKHWEIPLTSILNQCKPCK
eukprot:279414_1